MARRAANELHSDETLYAGESLWSPDGRFQAILQTDGNLCCYGYTPQSSNQAAQVCHWDSGRFFSRGAERSRLVFAAGGVPTILDNAGNVIWRQPNTQLGMTGDRLVIQNDNNFVLYSGSQPTWAHGRTTTVDDPTWVLPNQAHYVIPPRPTSSAIIAGAIVLVNEFDSPCPVLQDGRYAYVPPNTSQEYIVQPGTVAIGYRVWGFPGPAPESDDARAVGTDSTPQEIVVEPGQRIQLYRRGSRLRLVLS